MSGPANAPSLRAVLCPACSRYVGATDQPTGSIKLYCRSCRAYRTIDVTDPGQRRRDAGLPVRLIAGDEGS